MRDVVDPRILAASIPGQDDEQGRVHQSRLHAGAATAVRTDGLGLAAFETGAVGFKGRFEPRNEQLHGRRFVTVDMHARHAATMVKGAQEARLTPCNHAVFVALPRRLVLTHLILCPPSAVFEDAGRRHG